MTDLEFKNQKTFFKTQIQTPKPQTKEVLKRKKEFLTFKHELDNNFEEQKEAISNYLQG